MTIKGYFITGTDTDVGKTYFAVHLIKHLKRAGHSVLGIKPIGSEREDLMALKEASGENLDDSLISPVNYQGLVAPHLKINQLETITADSLWQKCQPALQLPYDYFIVEGCGGFLVPINEAETMADFAKKLNFPVILVVNMKLGCLNHALLTYHAIQAAGLQLAGWVANTIEDEMTALEENIATLQHWLKAPKLNPVNLGSFIEAHP